jgi:hypothetical protein
VNRPFEAFLQPVPFKVDCSQSSLVMQISAPTAQVVAEHELELPFRQQ